MSGKTKAQLLDEIREKDARIEALLGIEAAHRDTINTLLEEIDKLDINAGYAERAQRAAIREHVELLNRHLEGAKKIRSEGGRHAVTERHKKKLPPLPTLRELKREHDRVRESIREKRGKEPAPKTVHRGMALT